MLWCDICWIFIFPIIVLNISKVFAHFYLNIHKNISHVSIWVFSFKQWDFLPFLDKIATRVSVRMKVKQFHQLLLKTEHDIVSGNAPITWHKTTWQSYSVKSFLQLVRTSLELVSFELPFKVNIFNLLSRNTQRVSTFWSLYWNVSQKSRLTDLRWIILIYW